MDCKLVNDLINRLQVITNNLGMSNVCVVPFSFLFLRGQGIKIFSLVAKFCREENFLIKDLSDDDIDKNSYEGAIVFVPAPGIYFEPVVVMDYNSLYPSSMIAENISHDSIVGYKEYRLKSKIKNKESDEFELIKDTINDSYNNLDGYHYIDIEYDIFEGLDEDKKKIGYKVCKFAEADNGDKSVLPRILRKLLKARKDTRKIMEYYTFDLENGTSVEGIPDEKEDTYELFNVVNGKITIKKSDVINSRKTNNDFQISVLDGLQLAYKVTCNSLYGQVGATTSPICYKELAACTTATGRRMVITARDLTLNTFVGAKLTYGDSVSGDTPLLVMKNNFINIVQIQ
jgi:DNA polymerase elongation subunit (family B)